MKLYLIQHGESVTEDVNPDKPLSEKGVKDITSLASFLDKTNIKVSNIFHSSKTRAKQTAEILTKNISQSNEPSLINNISPNDPLDSLINELNNWNEDTAIVGHLPYLSKLVSFLITKNVENTIVNYKQGSICCLEKDEQGKWAICWMIRPELLI